MLQTMVGSHVYISSLDAWCRKKRGVRQPFNPVLVKSLPCRNFIKGHIRVGSKSFRRRTLSNNLRGCRGKWLVSEAEHVFSRAVNKNRNNRHKRNEARSWYHIDSMQTKSADCRLTVVTRSCNVTVPHTWICCISKSAACYLS